MKPGVDNRAAFLREDMADFERRERNANNGGRADWNDPLEEYLNRNVPMPPPLSPSRAKLAAGLKVSTENGATIVVWRHTTAGGGESRVEFLLMENPRMDLDMQLSSITALYKRDYIKEKAPHPVMCAFFRGMLNREDVRLKLLEGCVVRNGTIRSRGSPAGVVLKDVSLDSCILRLEARKLELCGVIIQGASSIELRAAESRLAGVHISKECVLLGDLGQATIEADCVIGCRASDMDFRQAEWVESRNGSSVLQRTGGIVVNRTLVTDEFARQANLTPMTAEEEERSYGAVKDRLDNNWG